MARIEWLLCRMAYEAIFFLPVRSRLFAKLLPFAGLYANTDGGFAEYRDGRTGFCTMALDSFDVMAAELNAQLLVALDDEVA